VQLRVDRDLPDAFALAVDPQNAFAGGAGDVVDVEGDDLADPGTGVNGTSASAWSRGDGQAWTCPGPRCAIWRRSSAASTCVGPPRRRCSPTATSSQRLTSCVRRCSTSSTPSSPAKAGRVWRRIRDDIGLPGTRLEVVVDIATCEARVCRTEDDLLAALTRRAVIVVVPLDDRAERALDRLREFRAGESPVESAAPGADVSSLKERETGRT
jgi:hypothetical protein